MFHLALPLFGLPLREFTEPYRLADPALRRVTLAIVLFHVNFSLLANICIKYLYFC